MSNPVDPLCFGPVRRNRYFTGKMMTAADFEADTLYLLGLHRLHNQVCHRWGVQHGLDVDRDPDCPGNVTVDPGVATDQCGRDLVLTRKRSVPVVTSSALLCAKYTSTPVDEVAPVSTASPLTPSPEFNRFEDGVTLEWVDQPTPEHVPLATVTLANGAVDQVTPVLSGTTRVTWVNWTHGKDNTSSTLEVRFSRPLHPTGSGVSPETFLVWQGDDREVVRRDATRWDPDAQAAVCRILGVPPGTTVYVSLLCDFILDERGDPVDGNHLRGVLPSGNGVPGGTFESWFHNVAAEVEP